MLNEINCVRRYSVNICQDTLIVLNLQNCSMIRGFVREFGNVVIEFNPCARYRRLKINGNSAINY